MNFLAYMIKGHARIVSENKTIEINEGDVFYIPRSLSYQSYWYGDNEIRFLSLGYLELNIKGNTKFELQTVSCDKQLISKIMSIPTNGTNIDCDSLSRFYGVMSEVIPHLSYSSGNRDEMLVDKIKDCIRRNPHVSVREIAGMCCISEPYLYLLFRRIAKITPNDYRLGVLCETGIELLVTTDKKVEEISDIINFSSASYFRKVLKRYSGSTPREIRKRRAF